MAVENLQALQQLIRDQTLPLDFKYYKTALPVDMPVLLVSSGRSVLAVVRRVMRVDIACIHQ